MSTSSRSLLLASACALTLLAGCSESHMTLGDAAPSDGGRGDEWEGVDAGLFYDSGPGADAMVSGRCPDGIDPFDPTSPASACSPDGAHCESGGPDVCGSAISCDCVTGHWQCRVAEPDPVCWCGRQPTAGDRCSMEGASCGECCPTPGGTGWPAMTCVGGQWAPAGCPELVCPPLPTACPAEHASALGQPCGSDGQLCGNPCCDAIQCSGGVWIEGPAVGCACDPSTAFACGGGTCLRGEVCSSACGPADGIEYSCVALLDETCSSCECAPVPPGYRCEVRDGSVFFAMEGFCG